LYPTTTPPGPEHAGVYASWGLWVSFDLKRANLILQPGIEVAPETRRWGFIPTITADFPVHKRLGIDVTAMLMHDQYAVRPRSSGEDVAHVPLTLGRAVAIHAAEVAAVDEDQFGYPAHLLDVAGGQDGVTADDHAGTGNGHPRRLVLMYAMPGEVEDAPAVFLHRLHDRRPGTVG